MRAFSVAVWLGTASVLAAADAPRLAEELNPPVRLEADGAPIDHGAAWGHAGPCVFDADGDGLRDLVVGDFGGTFTLYRNVGGESRPRYEKSGTLMAGDEPAKVWIYCCVGSSPQFADLDGDGTADLLSGSYDPGAVYWFPGKGDGTFRPRDAAEEERLGAEAKGGDGEDRSWRLKQSNGTPLRDRSGRVILLKPDQLQHHESYGSWPFPVDWDADGDLDLLIGGFDGTIHLRENLGSPTAFSFADRAVQIEAGGAAVEAEPYEPGKPRAAHAAVVAADWDGDGRFDLVSGFDDGSVRWFRNVGEKGRPEFAAAEFLVPPYDGSGYDRFLEPGETPPPGIRAQVAVADTSGDGKPDLLVGDFSTTRSRRSDLSGEEAAAYEAARVRYREKLDALMARLKDDHAEVRRLLDEFPEEERTSEAAEEKYQAKYQELRAAPAYVAAEEAYEAAKKDLERFLEKPEGARSYDEYAAPHGFVWLYLRK